MTPVGHSLMGTALGILSLPQHRSPRWKGAYFATFALLANLPDFPLPYWGHDRYDVSHSLFVNLLLSLLAVALCAWRPSVRQHVGGPAVLVTSMLAWLSHLLLDAFYNHGRGVAIFWPFSPASLALPIAWFSVVSLIPPITSAHLWEYAAEFASYVPLAVGAYVIRRTGILAQLVRACSRQVC
jgi:membrane-bound metal-dependent hydrolase YbcI (DUF457 family)